MGEINDNVELGKKIKELREDQKLSQERLSDKVDITRTYLSDIERGKRSPSYDIVKKIADALGVSINDLEGVSVEKPEVPESLKEFAETRNLPPEDVRMLANIEYRGRKPDSPNDWKRLYDYIKVTLEEEEG